MSNRISSVTVDCLDTRALAAFWTAVLGWTVVDEEDGVISIAAADGAPFGMDLIPVPAGPKVGKNRLHLDLRPVDRDQAAELERLLALGARPVDVGQSDDVSWHVLADPEGNEFCLLRGRA
jgi:catechol 2,3-dioxygenase-like lactoylglutathione lyase family enzyme